MHILDWFGTFILLKKYFNIEVTLQVNARLEVQIHLAVDKNNHLVNIGCT